MPECWNSCPLGLGPLLVPHSWTIYWVSDPWMRETYGGRIKLIWIHTPCILFTFSQGKNEDSFTAYRFCTHCLLCILLLKVNYNLPYSLVFTCHSSSFSAVITLHSVHSSQHQNGVQLTRRTFRFVCCWPDGHCSAFIRALVVRISQFLLGRPLPGVCCGE